MKLDFDIADGGSPHLTVNGNPWLRGVEPLIYRAGEGLTMVPAGEWESTTGQDRTGVFTVHRRVYSHAGEPLLRFTIQIYSDIAHVDIEVLRDISGIARGDSFTTPGALLPWFSIPADLSFFLATFGLGGDGDDYPGGYWPTAKFGIGPGDLPDDAFAPIVLYDDKAALAVGPGNFFLTSPLVRMNDGIGRGVHGAVDRLSVGTHLETVFAVGEDVPDALMRFGDYLLARGGKSRPRPDEHSLFSRLGWWNAYGGYYTEPIRKLDADGLSTVVTELRNQHIPVGYLGLDLWYPYDRIGQALKYVPDPTKYPHGIREIARTAAVSTVLHLSALSPKNEYGADGADPTFYQEVARDLTREAAIVAWHDWLRTQQHLTPMLRADQTAAESWFAGMARAFADSNLDVLLCMQTMGMNLAATQHANIIAGRVHTDYLFSQPEALAEAARRGHPEFQLGHISTSELHRQNMLMGMVLYALGMMPFHDLFLSRVHPGLGGGYPEQEAVLRALSCGPVGIGDGPGMSDRALIQRLLLPDGTVAHPDHPPFPIMKTMGADVEAFFTVHRAGETTWGYLMALNTTDKEAPFRIAPPFDGEFLIWDGLKRRVVTDMSGTLPPGGIAYFVLVPTQEGIGLLGQKDLFIPAGVGLVEAAAWNSGWHVEFGRPVDQITVLSKHSIGARDMTGTQLEVAKQAIGVWSVQLNTNSNKVHIYRR